jgi:hypothetical protein
MTKFSAYLKISFAMLLYIISAFTFVDYIFSLLILDTVTAIENAFGKLVILIFMLVLAKLILAAGKAQLKKKQGDGTEQFRPSETNDPFQLNRSESEIHEQGKEAESKRKPFWNPKIPESRHNKAYFSVVAQLVVKPCQDVGVRAKTKITYIIRPNQ